MKKIISCSVYKTFIEAIIDEKKYDIEYLEIGRHNQPYELNRKLTDLINNSQNYDEIFLLYGICGNAISGLSSKKAKLHVLRVHDCFATLLGSNKRYFDLVKNNDDYQWRCSSNYDSNYLKEQYNEFCELYGEENAEYLLSIYGKKADKIFYVSFETKEDQLNIESYSNNDNVIVLKGSLEMLEKFFNEEEEASLNLECDEKIECVYDEEEIIKKVKK